jgi:hypothetical protein
VARGVDHTEVELCVYIALGRSEPIPLERFRIIRC